MPSPHTPSRLRAFFASLGHALQLVWRSSPRLTLGNAFVAAAQALLPLAGLYALKRAVDAAAAATHHLAAGSSGDLWSLLRHEPAAREVAVWFVIGAAVMGATALLRVAASWLGELHAMAVSDHVHALLHRKMLEVDLAFFEDSAEQNRLHLAQEQAMTRPVGVLGSVFQLLQGVVGFLGVLVLLAALHPLVAVALALAGLPALLVRLHRTRRLYEWQRSLAPLEREAGYFHHLITSGDTAKEARLQGYGGFCRDRFAAVRERLRAARLAWRRQILSQEFGMQLFALAVVAALLLWMTGRLLAGALTLGALVMYAQAVQRGQGLVGGIVSSVVDLYQSSLFLQAFEELLRLPARVSAPASPRPVPSPPQQGITFEHVSFAYPGTERPVLQDLSFTLAPGEALALVGANGAGKSTVVKLLCRLYDPTAGRILVDGLDLRTLDPAAWRSRIGVLFQDFARYQLTAAENVWLGDPRGDPADPRVAAAVERAGLADAARSWPHGLRTPLGRWLHPGGVEPSAGQWQRVALARALLREADLLVLDEPTSALDAHTQHAVIRTLQAAAAGRAALIVSHRPEMLALATRVIVLRDGIVAEQGTVAALRATGGEFARLFAE
jgi:ATP-binding cassette subfamily B protein